MTRREIAKPVPSATRGISRLALLAMTVMAGCASSGLEQRVAQLEQELKAARLRQGSGGQGARPMAAGELVAIGDATAAADMQPLVMFVDERPEHCDGALCWAIENGHPYPVLPTIGGVLVTVVGPMGPLLPARSVGFIRLTTPQRAVIEYDVHDTISMGDASTRMPLPTVLYRCRLEADVGGATDAYWGGHRSRLDPTFCM